MRVTGTVQALFAVVRTGYANGVEEYINSHFDGVIWKSANGDTEYVAFSPAQIKSELGNNGNYDASNPDIRFSFAEDGFDGQDALDNGPAQGSLLGNDAQAFQAWFAGSKVVDTSGKPLVVYHGTGADTGNVFLPGTYFTPRTDVADIYAKAPTRQVGGDGPNVTPVFLSLRNPYVHDDQSTGENLSHAVLGRRGNMEEVRENLRSRGFDGIVIKNYFDLGGMQDQYVAFSPTQIKSAIGNNGNYDAANPDIRFSLSEDGFDGQGALEDGSTQGPLLGADAQAFKTWFGDSEVVDAQGRPLVVYHGSPDPDITEFEHGTTAYGIFFTPDPATADYYNTGKEGKTYAVYLKVDKLADFDDPGVFDVIAREAIDFTEVRDDDAARQYASEIYSKHYGENETITKFFDAIDGIREVGDGYAIAELMRDEGIGAGEIEDLVNDLGTPRAKAAFDEYAPSSAHELAAAREAYGSQEFYMTYQDDFMRAAISLGYDGVLFSDPSSTGVSTSYVVFRSTQIKAAIDNNGNFDATNPDIRFSLSEDGFDGQGALDDGSTQGSLLEADAQAFQTWFADSKIVDAQGRPLVVYHGTNADFKAFDRAHINDPMEGGFFFSPDAVRTSPYGDKRIAAYISMQRPFEISVLQWLDGYYEDDNGESIQIDARKLRANGYDGIIIGGDQSSADEPSWEFGNDVFIAFESTQIKSAIDNNGNYDATNPDIRFSLSEDAVGPDESAPLPGYNHPMSNIKLSPEAAGNIARLLLEFEALNRKRELVNTLMGMGVTRDIFREWCALAKSAPFGASTALLVDVENLLIHLENGIEVKDDVLWRTSPRVISKLVAKAVDAQQAVVDKSKPARSSDRDSGPSGP